MDKPRLSRGKSEFLLFGTFLVVGDDGWWCSSFGKRAWGKTLSEAYANWQTFRNPYLPRYPALMY